MKIAYVCDSYPPVINGVSHVVEVITLDSSWHLPKVEEADGVLVRRFPGVSPGGSYHFPFPDYQLLSSTSGFTVRKYYTHLQAMGPATQVLGQLSCSHPG